jgi:hypothetical protein
MLTEIPLINAEQWDKIVKSFKEYDVYYLSGYTKAFQIHGDGDPILLLYEDDTIRAMNVVMKRDIEKDKSFAGKIPPNTYFDFSTPYGYGGFIVEGNITEKSLTALDEEYSAYCKKNGIISEIVRFHPVLRNSTTVASIYDVSELGKTITMQLSSEQQIWSDIVTKNRNRIRKAINSNIQIYRGLSNELITDFIPLYNRTMDKDDASDYYYFKEAYYDSFFNDLKDNTLFFYSVYEEKIIAIAIILFANQQMHYHLCAIDTEYQQLAPMNLLLYEAACWGLKNGYKTFHLGGGVGCKEDSLFSFKRKFNKNSDTYFSIGKKIFDKEKYQELVAIRKQQEDCREDTSFFPAYRG